MKSLPVVVVLGAGQGSRYKGARHKLAETLGSHSVLARTVRNAIASGLPVVVVTTPAFGDEAARLVARRDVVVLGLQNGGVAPGGMGDSIAAGVAARPSAPGWLLLPADMPLVKPETLLAVAAALNEHAAAYAQHKGRRGHPVAFGAELLSELLRLTGEEGARRILARYPAVGVEVPDPGVLLDMDTEQDLVALRAKLSTEV
ncbi:MAG: nucleotidyltransferase family protein [Vitreoscilla sp.]|nr:nucleotidyltransferase family protein [Burkholderiales bacterium]MBP6336613.1 nucleotidyltransferase family protein [Vitreoscilla sp.]MBP6675667.1 nucleotidyltransferase family protein [Vitreoscilla sp.]